MLCYIDRTIMNRNVMPFCYYDRKAVSKCCLIIYPISVDDNITKYMYSFIWCSTFLLWQIMRIQSIDLFLDYSCTLFHLIRLLLFELPGCCYLVTTLYTGCDKVTTTLEVKLTGVQLSEIHCIVSCCKIMNTHFANSKGRSS